MSKPTIVQPTAPELVRRGRPTKAHVQAAQQAAAAKALLAGLDALNVSALSRVSADVYAKLREAKEAAKIAEQAGAVHCPDWLSAQVKPKGDRGGGYPYLIETEDFTVKVAGQAQTMWPGLYLELRSHFLHTHSDGAQGACREALAWVRDRLLYDGTPADLDAAQFDAVTVSRVDLHIDWQGGFVPTFSAGEERRFIRPRRMLWHPFIEGNTCLGYRFGTGKPMMARIYNKTAERKKRQDESYRALLIALHGEAYNPALDVWRLEFEVHRAGVTSLKLAPESDAEDTDADIEAELSAEDLPNVGTLPRLFAHLDAIFAHLSYHWLRLVEPSASQTRSRWPLDPTWDLLRREFARLAAAPPLSPEALTVVRGARYSGRARLLLKMANGLLNSLEVEDTSVASACLSAIQDSKWHEQMRRRAEAESKRVQARRRRALAEGKQARRQLLERLDKAQELDTVEEDDLRARLAVIEDQVQAHLALVEEGRSLAQEREKQVQHRLQTLLGVFDAYGVTARQPRPVASVADLFTQHLGALEAEADKKGGIAQLLHQHFEKTYRVSAPRSLFEAE